jgi:hypothetical protein
MSNLRLQVSMIVATVVLFVGALVLNEWGFTHAEFVRGVNWVYLPAGVRLLCTLLFGEAGAIGLLIASWLVSFLYFFPNDFSRAFMGGIVATVAPYVVYKLAQKVFGLRASLTNLTPKRLLICVVAYSIASPLLHHIWFALHGDTNNLVQGFLVMFAGDLSGTVIVIYAMKGLLSLLPARRVGMRRQIDSDKSDV